MPLPKQGQTKEEFIKMFMSDKAMVEKHPDEKQRYAIALSEWKKHNKLEDLKAMILLDKSVGEVKPTDKPQWVKTFPRGNYFVQKLGRKLPFNSEFFGHVMSAFTASTLAKPSIDKNHEFKESFGDILAMEERNDGLYANVKLNTDGVDMVKNRKYKFISPAFGEVQDYEEKTFPAKLEAISLTNWPALEGALPEIQSQIALSKYSIATEYTNEMEVKQMAVLTELAKQFNLAEDATEEMALAKVKESVDRVTALEKDMKDKEEKIVALEKTINDAKQAELLKEADEYIGNMIKLGKLHPSTQELDKEDYLKDKDRFIRRMELTKAPEKPTIDPSSVITDEGGKEVKVGDIVLTKGDLEAMKKFDLSSKDAEEVKVYLGMKKKHPEIGGAK